MFDILAERMPTNWCRWEGENCRLETKKAKNDRIRMQIAVTKMQNYTGNKYDNDSSA